MNKQELNIMTVATIPDLNGWTWHPSSSTPAHKMVRIVGGFLEALHLPGEVAEFGCYKGETSRNFVSYLEGRNVNKTVYLYDSFRGLQNFGEKDHSNQELVERHSGTCRASLYDVQRTLHGFSRYVVIPGPLETTLHEKQVPAELCFSYIDTDLYSGTLAALKFAIPRTVPGGCIIVDDYEAPWWPGVKSAVDDMLEQIPANMHWYVYPDPKEHFWQCILWRTA